MKAYDCLTTGHTVCSLLYSLASLPKNQLPQTMHGLKTCYIHFKMARCVTFFSNISCILFCPLP